MFERLLFSCIVFFLSLSRLYILSHYENSFCHSWFRLQSITIHCNQRVCVDRYTSHVFFLMHLAHVITVTSWLKVSVVRISLHPHAIHDVICLSVRLLSLRVCLSPVTLPLLPFLFTVYLFSVLLINFHVVGTAED